MKILDECTDTEIRDRVLDGQIDLFEVLIRRHNATLYKTGRCYGYSDENTKDLMQDTFVDAYCNLSKFENRSSFQTWITKIMLNNCYKKRHRARSRFEIPSDINDKSIPMFSGDSKNDTNRLVLNGELKMVVESALQRIPIEYRMVFSLRELSGLRVAETAEIMGISQSNVKVRFNRAKAMLRKEVEKSYSLEEIYDFNLVYCDAMVKQVMQRIVRI